jgi:hypothetical protein
LVARADELHSFTLDLRRNVMKNPVVLITRALTGTGRTTAVALSRALGLNKVISNAFVVPVQDSIKSSVA